VERPPETAEFYPPTSDSGHLAVSKGFWSHKVAGGLQGSEFPVWESKCEDACADNPTSTLGEVKWFI
jgi:hypothetical protein